jgi:hypothetical protein
LIDELTVSGFADSLRNSILNPDFTIGYLQEFIFYRYFEPDQLWIMLTTQSGSVIGAEADKTTLIYEFSTTK